MALDRGNDSENARRDLAGQYGEHANAEDLINAQDGKFDVELDKALNKPVDPDLTRALDVDSIDSKFDGGIVRSAAVRGGRLVVVEEHEGTLKKWSEPYGGGNSGAKQAAKQAAAGVGAGGGAGVAGGSTPDAAPEAVKVDAMREKLEELQIAVPSDTRKKDDIWALVPQEARDQLVAAADQQSA